MTFPGKGDLTSIDIRNYLELGLKNIRFKLAHVLTRQAKIEMFQMLRDAVDWYCKKYEITKLPITTWIDIPNSLIRTGVLKKVRHDHNYLRKRIYKVEKCK